MHLDKALRTLRTGQPNALVIFARATSWAVAVVEALDALLVRVSVGEAGVAGAQERSSVTVPTRRVWSARVTCTRVFFSFRFILLLCFPFQRCVWLSLILFYFAFLCVIALQHLCFDLRLNCVFHLGVLWRVVVVQVLEGLHKPGGERGDGGGGPHVAPVASRCGQARQLGEALIKL